MVDKVMVDKVLEAIDEVVRAEGNWSEKRDAIKAAAQETEGYETNLEEFVTWFVPDEEEEDDDEDEEDTE